ncbi:hypothetical protein [Sphingomonas solaris]|uniref:hypothetical protein n=1 Tax=Alterirhizorhabdus solaris TaxID=2529389 RepID=UPI001396BBFB|nr:hypothetical protein [Sphingomonas solaris]
MTETASAQPVPMPAVAPPAGASRWRLGLIGLWLAACAWLLAGRAGAIAAMRMPDSDDALRLLQVRDWLGGQGWFDLRQYRLDPPAGADIHWTRLVDLPLAAIIVPLRPLVGVAMAEMVAAAAVPLVTLLAAMAVLAALARRLIVPAAWWWAPLLLLLASPVMGMMAPLRIDHHGWQIVLVLTTMLGLTAADRRRGGMLAGLAIAASLTIGVEMLPYLVLAVVLAALAWVVDAREGVRLRWLCGAAGVGVAIGLIGFVPAGQRFAGTCDALSAAYALPLWAGGTMLAVATIWSAVRFEAWRGGVGSIAEAVHAVGKSGPDRGRSGSVGARVGDRDAGTGAGCGSHIPIRDRVGFDETDQRLARAPAIDQVDTTGREIADAGASRPLHAGRWNTASVQAAGTCGVDRHRARLAWRGSMGARPGGAETSVTDAGNQAAGRIGRACWLVAAGLAVAAGLLAGGGGTCLIDPYHAVDPAARALWLDRVSEALPLWRQGAEVFWASLALPLIGLAGAAMMGRRGPRRAWGMMLAMGALSIVLALVSTRAAVAAQALALPGAAALGWHGRARLAASGSMIVRVFGSVVLFLCVSAIAPRLLVATLAATPPGRTDAAAEAGDAACMAPRALAALDVLPAATMLATIDATPALLLHTHHRGLAGPYHRNGRAIADTMRAWGGTPAAARAIVRRHAIDFVIACGEPAEAQLYDRRAPDGFHARLMRGEVPGWLVRVRVPGTPWHVWRVRGAG